MMRRFVLGCAIAAALAGGAARAQQASPAASASAAVALTPAAPAAVSPPAAVPAPVLRPAATATSAPALPAAPMGMSAGPAAGSLLQTIFALCLVLGLLAALAWFLKRYGPRAHTGCAHLRLVGTLNLGGRERIMVVEVGEQWIVLGASPGRINALATMARQPGVEAGAVQAGAVQAGAMLTPHTPPAASFAAWLKQTIEQRHAP